ncbi:MAG: HEAT repeat domain-containing protein, partial [Phycisphaerae bacterium]
MPQAFAWLLLPLIALALCAAGTGDGDAATQDPWTSGYALDGWDRIAALQRYPVLDASPPHWDAVCGDANPLVRTAAAMAIARAPNPALIPVLRPMLKDENPLVRCWALRALLEIRSPCIREPLLEVLANWKDFETADERGFEFGRVGLPLDMAKRPLRDRRQWVQQYAPAWTVDTTEPVLDWSTRLETTACVQASEIDAGDPVALRFRVQAQGADERLSLGLAGMFVSWRAIDADGRPTPHRPYELRHQFPHDMGEPKRDRIDLVPGPNGPFDLTVLTQDTPPPPGMYLFETLYGEALLIRVRRSAAMEARIPDLLKGPIDAETAKMLGRQRVRVAVGPLIEAFRESDGTGPLALAAAEALGRIGDPRAAGVLLDHPQLNRSEGTCMAGGSTFGALKRLGRAAWPACERRLRSWRGRLAGDKALGLVLALRVLGPHGSGEAIVARQEMIRDLSAALGREREPRRDDPRPVVLAAAVRAVAPNQPDLVVEAVNRLAARPGLAARLLREVRNGPCPEDIEERIARDVWRLVQSRPADDPVRTTLTDLLGRMGPEIFAETGRITNEAEAVAAMHAVQAVRHTLPPEALRRLRQETCDRVEAWLKTAPGPPIRGMPFRLSLARLYLAAERYEACFRLLSAPEVNADRLSQRIAVAAFRGLA